MEILAWPGQYLNQAGGINLSYKIEEVGYFSIGDIRFESLSKLNS